MAVDHLTTKTAQLEAEAYWKTQLFRGELTGFPANKASKESRGPVAKVRFLLPQELSERIQEVTQGSSYSILIMLLSGIAAVLHRYTGTSEILIGTPVLNVDWREGVAPLLPIGCRLSDKEPFSSLLEATHTSLEQGSRYLLSREQHEQFMNQLFGREACLRTVVSMEGIQGAEEAAVGDMDILFQCFTSGHRIELNAHYDSAKYSEENVERILHHLSQFLNGALSAAQLPCASISLITDEEKHTLLHEFNKTSTDYPRELTFVDRFKQTVGQMGNRRAILWGDDELTYDELERKSNRIAQYLIDRGVTRETIVGIVVKPSFEMIIGLVGILKSGGAFVPIDPDYPKDRIAYILNNSNARILLTEEGLADSLSFPHSVNISSLLQEEYHGELPLEARSRPQDTAYVVYTSGTTGEPKGVMISHQALHNLCAWHIRHFQVTPDDRGTKYAGFGFDASVWEIFPYLLTGASLCIIPEEIRLNLMKLHQFYKEKQITISFLPTPLFEKFVELPQLPLRKLLTGGDTLRISPSTLYETVNNYGPSENTVVSTTFTLEGTRDPVPIGRPIDNTRIFILDASDGLQPIGVPGELCISGEGLSKGYINNEELSQLKFVPNPYLPGSNMYRTGDRARWHSDGTIEFMGRLDDQLKIRGVRIEPKEIEKQFLSHPQISDCCILGIAASSEGMRLVAFYECKDALNPNELKVFLSTRLPEVMVPSIFIRLDRIPMTPNGKVDKKTLMQLHSEQEDERKAAVSQAGMPGLTDTESFLLAIWKAILGTSHLTIHDNFFEAGGNSLLLVDMHTQLESRFPDRVDVADLFSYPSIYQLALYIEKKNEGHAHSEYLEWRIAKELKLSLQEAAENAKGSLPALALAIYLYILFECLDQRDMKVNVSAFSREFSFLFDFNGIDDFGILIRKANEEWMLAEERNGKRFTQPTGNLAQGTASEDGSVFHVSFDYCKQEEGIPVWNGNGNVYLGITEHNDAFECRLECRRQLGKGRVKELQERYIQLLELLIELNRKGNENE
ncbi:amino acid adenylation domain-containing protein [Paenibacillus sp. SI8]|uniref:non-ribosomal peptide synthetase n=1 Tax=unclassified Paenibacillus TaxID=185978 RepID=UPI003467C909